MTINLSKDLEQIVHDAVRSGLYPAEEDVIRDALTRLKQAMPSPIQKPTRKSKVIDRPDLAQNPVTAAELDRRLLASGLVAHLPNPADDIDDDDEPPIKILGEPISETILRERR